MAEIQFSYFESYSETTTQEIFWRSYNKLKTLILITALSTLWKGSASNFFSPKVISENDLQNQSN